MQDNKWTIEELLARYQLEPELRDVFVEGTFDREILTHHLHVSGTGHAFYEIDSVDVPAALLAVCGLTSGNKQRALALSKELASVPAEARVYCLVDRDLDHWFGELESSARLRWTSFCSIENHFLTAETIRDVVITTSRAKITNFDEFVASLLSVLRQLYALRLADRELALNLSWVATRRYLSARAGAFAFDLPRYTQALLNANSATGKKSEFLKTLDSWQEKLDCDIRLTCRGHDYTELLAWAIAEFKGLREFATTVAVERLFVLLARSVSSLGNELQ